MGRLTLNMLLSFAQFEREVTGERIRDKIAASRQKGMWMGGTPPLGYTIKDRKLVVIPEEAEAVRFMFQEYLACSKTTDLLDTLEKRGIRSKTWVSRSTNIKRGGGIITKAILYVLLHNRTYIGEAVHKGKSYPGEHSAIVSKDLFSKVQTKLNERNCKAEHNQHQFGGLLSGLLFDSEDRPYSSIYCVKKNPLKYHHYYVRPHPIQEDHLSPRGPNIRIEKIDKPVLEYIRKCAPQQPFA